MKKIFFILISFSSLAFAETKNLVCTSGYPFETFKAVLDDSPYEPGSGYFNIVSARVADNYATAQLICAGHTMNEEIRCVGFWFGSANSLAEVIVQNSSATHNSPRTFNMLNGPWPCHLEAHSE